MSDRPTPETDAFFYRKDADLKTIWLCERLERERDEARRERDKAIIKAREQNAKLREEARLYCRNSDFHREMREKAERERDEAREKLQALEKPATEDDSTPPAIRQMWANVDAKMIADGFQKGEYGLWHKKEGAQ